MRTLRSWATKIALVAGAAGGVVAACYNDVPGPSAPLPPTREVSPQGPAPGPLTPPPTIAIDGGLDPSTSPSGARVIETHTQIAPQAKPSHDVVDAGTSDTLDLPPVPDADVPLDAPGIKK